MISVLIPTLNERRNLVDCLASVRWADDIRIIDSGSTDGTMDLARSAGARVIEFHWNEKFPKKKNWALENVSWEHDWILILDADERITNELAEEIINETKNPKADGYFINRKFMFMSRWIRHCGYYPSWNLRLFRHKLGRYEEMDVGDTGSGDNEVHEHVILQGKTAYLKNFMLHYAYPDIYAWAEKHNRYSNWEAQIEVYGLDNNGEGIGKDLSQHRKLRKLSRRLPFRPTLRFFYNYVLRRGFLDSREGFALCRLLKIYEYLIVLKKAEIYQCNAGKQNLL